MAITVEQMIQAVRTEAIDHAAEFQEFLEKCNYDTYVCTLFAQQFFALAANDQIDAEYLEMLYETTKDNILLIHKDKDFTELDKIFL